MPSTPGPVVYDVRKIKAYIGTEAVEDLGTDGITITPEVENTLIQGLYGTLGFNIDPSSAVTITLSLKSSSATNTTLMNKFNNREIFTFSVQVTDEDYVSAIGFSTIRVDNCIVQKPAEFSTNEKEAPDYEWTIIGYGYSRE